METNKLERLLARYYDGTASEAEEEELKRIMAEGNVPPGRRAEKEIFRQLAQTAPADIPEGLERRLSDSIDRWEACGKAAKRTRKHARRMRLQWAGSIAASLLVLLSIGWYLQEYRHAPTPKDTCATPEEAYAQAQKALVLFAGSLNKGLEQVGTVRETAGKIQEDINKQMKRINHLQQ